MRPRGSYCSSTATRPSRGERSRRELAGDRFFGRDEWLRRLLGALALEEGIVAVVAGREPPRWAEADEDTRITGEHLDLQLVGSLSDAYAGEYLERIRVVDAALRECLLEYARVEVNQIHPLYLGLCADIVWRAKARRETLTPDDFRSAERVADKGQELIRRLLSYVDRETDTAVRALSAARAFNRDIYLALGQRLHFEATIGAFDVLRRFSFTWGAEARGQDWYRIHDLLRRLFAERPEDSDLIHAAHVTLEQYYRDRAAAGDGVALAEAIYHANRLDWERGATEWVEVFDQALQLRRYGLCGVLLEVRNELRIDSSFMHGRVSRAEGEYFASLARYNEARQEYEEAIAAYDSALAHAPDDVEAHNNKGLVLARLGDLQAVLSEYGQARESYEQAVASYDAALDRAPDYVAAHNNKGNVLQSLGDLQAGLSEHRQARGSYEQAIASYDAALDRAPDLVEAHNNKGNVLASLGELHAEVGEVAQAARYLRAAVAEWVRSLEIAPGDRRIHESRDQAETLLEYLEMTPEQLIAGLPASVRDAVENEGSITFEQAFTALPPLEQRRVAMALLSIQAQRLGSEDEEDSSELAAVLANFEPLLQAVAAVAAGDTAQQHEIEEVLANLETNGWRLTEPVQRIWAGERDETALTAGLDAQDTALVKRLLQILGEGT